METVRFASLIAATVTMGAGPADRIADPAAVRRAFERPWVRANLWRTLLTTASTVLLAWALVRYGQSR
ncbi:hypothetical protein [Streptomyces sp. NPDC029003]|uniref:hypothetical protein n=1 Tax=Streptomyces sp. NPDC029003 TaxID=3155125 RepID=UPI0034000BDF